MTKKELSRAGWFSVTAAALLAAIASGLVPWFREFSGWIPSGLYLFLDAAYLILLILVYRALNRFLNSRFQFSDLDSYASNLVWIPVALVIVLILDLGLSFVQINGTRVGATNIFLSTSVCLIILLFVITTIVFLIKLLRLPNNLYELLKPFAYTGVASAHCLATFILFPVGLILWAVQYVMLAMIFFNAADEITT